MKYLFTAFFLFGITYLSAQNQKPEFDPAKLQPPYKLTAPQEWSVERFPIPSSVSRFGDAALSYKSFNLLF